MAPKSAHHDVRHFASLPWRRALSILLISAALCYTFGVMVGNRRQGWAILAAMTAIFVVLLVVCAVAEQNGHTLVKQGVDHTASALSSGGNCHTADSTRHQEATRRRQETVKIVLASRESQPAGVQSWAACDWPS
jgi:potassium-transporting ATPase A subunit